MIVKVVDVIMLVCMCNFRLHLDFRVLQFALIIGRIQYRKYDCEGD